MSVLAWLMLVSTSLSAAPHRMHAHLVHAVVAAAEAGAVHCHHHHAAAVATTPSCCDGHNVDCCGRAAGHSCGCAAVCSAAVPPGLVVIDTAASLSTTYELPAANSTPLLPTAPPLRPPTV